MFYSVIPFFIDDSWWEQSTTKKINTDYKFLGRYLPFRPYSIRSLSQERIDMFKHEEGYGKRLGWGARPALLLIDVCTGYWSTGCNLDLSHNPEAVAAPDSMRRLLAAARAGKSPVVWAQVRYNHPTMKDAGVQILKSKTIQVWQDGDTRGFDAWMPGLSAAPEDTVIYKRNPSAFFGTTLTTDLQLMNIDTLVMCGVSTSGCVRASTMDAICHGFRPMVVSSACGDRSPEIQEANLRDLEAKYADIVSEEEAISKLKAGW